MVKSNLTVIKIMAKVWRVKKDCVLTCMAWITPYSRFSSANGRRLLSRTVMIHTEDFDVHTVPVASIYKHPREVTAPGKVHCMGRLFDDAKNRRLSSRTGCYQTFRVYWEANQSCLPRFSEQSKVGVVWIILYWLYKRKMRVELDKSRPKRKSSFSAMAVRTVLI